MLVSTIKKQIVLGLVLCVVVSVRTADVEQMPTTDMLTVSKEAFADLHIERPDFSTDNQDFVQVIDQEIVDLRKRFGHGQVDLHEQEVQAVAPKLSIFITGIIAEVARRARIDVPGASLLLADGSLQYNAAAQRATMTWTVTKSTYAVYPDGRKEKIGEEKNTEKSSVSDIVIGAELVRLFAWRKAYVGLLIAIVGHEVGHIVHEHSEEAQGNEHQADLFAANLLARGADLVVALDMLSLAAHTYNTLKDFVYKNERLYDLVKATVNRTMMDVPDLGELGNASTHAYAATVVYNALRKKSKSLIADGDFDTACFEVYEALKQSCNAPSAVFGMPKEEVERLCLEMERKASYLNAFKQTHPAPLNRKRFIEAVSKKA